ncbi:hypothetical protein BT095_11795, partial [Corynebacterium diphtheriae]|uniref:hypothetical protein n=1 Tax=Corynebacterium diphtheriae TaxID=1717 RepID=UPI000D493659
LTVSFFFFFFLKKKKQKKKKKKKKKTKKVFFVFMRQAYWFGDGEVGSVEIGVNAVGLVLLP